MKRKLASDHETVDTQILQIRKLNELVNSPTRVRVELGVPLIMTWCIDRYLISQCEIDLLDQLCAQSCRAADLADEPSPRLKGWSKLSRAPDLVHMGDTTRLRAGLQKMPAYPSSKYSLTVTDPFGEKEYNMERISYLGQVMASVKQLLGVEQTISIPISEYFVKEGSVPLRPYLTKRTRERLEKSGIDYLKVYPAVGDPLHVPFTETEIEIINAKRAGAEIVTLADWCEICKSLPGRVPVDCIRFTSDEVARLNAIVDDEEEIDSEDEDAEIRVPPPQPVEQPIIYTAKQEPFRVQNQIFKNEFGLENPRKSNKLFMKNNISRFKLYRQVKLPGGSLIDVKMDPSGKTNNAIGLSVEYQSHKEAFIYNPDTCQAITLSSHNEGCTEGHFSLDGREVITTGNDGSVVIWNSRSGQKKFAYAKQGDPVIRLAIHKSEPLVAACYRNSRSVVLINYKNYQHSDVNEAQNPKERWPAPIADAAFGFHHYSNYLVGVAASAEDEDTEQTMGFGTLIDINRPDIYRNFSNQAGETGCVSCNPREGALFATGSSDPDNSIFLYDMRKLDLQPTSIFKTKHRDMMSLYWSPCGVYLSSSGSANAVYVFDMRNNTQPVHILRHEIDNSTTARNFVSASSWTKQGCILATGGDDCTVRLWDIASGDPHFLTLRHHQKNVNFVDFSPYSDHLISGADDGILNVYSNISSKKEIV
eukprot:gene12833-15065_t